MVLPASFGLFQGLMPIAGFLAGSFAAAFLERYAGIVSFLILGIIGGNMIASSVRGSDGEGALSTLSATTVFVQAVATSIDAFAVGVSFVAEGIAVAPAAAVIALCTFVLCCAMLLIGPALARKLGSKAELVGGIILVLIGLRNLLS